MHHGERAEVLIIFYAYADAAYVGSGGKLP
jgi:hypothetical protein